MDPFAATVRISVEQITKRTYNIYASHYKLIYRNASKSMNRLEFRIYVMVSVIIHPLEIGLYITTVDYI